MMTLDTFDQQLPKDLLKKAQPYAKNGAVLYVEQDSNGVWQAEVAGSDTYSVEITLDGRTIFDSFCDCPIESTTCKHIVAVLFTLREMLRKQVNSEKKAGTVKAKKTTGKLTIADLVQELSADELRTFLVEYATSDKTLAAKLQLHFAAKDDRIDVGDHYVELVRKLVHAHTDRRGFIDYRSTFKLVKELNTLLTTGIRLISQHNFKDALALSMILLEEITTVLTKCDDSAGNISGSLRSAVELLREIALHDDTALPLRRQLFDKLAEALTDKRYFTYSDAGLSMLDVMRQTSLKLHEPDLFLELLRLVQSLLGSTDSSFYQDYLRTLRVKFLRDIDRDEEAYRETEANMDIVQVRVQAVDKAIQTKQYDRAKTLVTEGIRLAEAKKHPGIVHQWMEKLLDIAEAERAIDDIRRLTRQFAFDRWFNVDYFRRWKATFSPDEWTVEYRVLVEKIRQDIAKEAAKRRSGWGYNAADALLSQLGPIFQEEKQWAELLVLLQQAPRLDALKQMMPYLVGIYPSEMLALVLPAIRQLAEQANTRSDYKNVASWITSVRKTITGSHGATDELIDELKQMYVKRPAMQDELQRIK